MALWELDEFAGAKFLGYVRGVPEPPGFSGQRWLPNDTTDDLAFEYIKGASNKTVMASVMGFDAEAPIEGRPALGEKVQGELPPIKRKARIGEKELIRFLQPRVGTADKRAAIMSVYDITDRLLGGVQARVEWLRLKALSENTVVYNESGVIFEFDFGINNALQFDIDAGTDADSVAVTGMAGIPWSTVATADPLADEQAMVDRYKSVTGGIVPAEHVMSSAAVGYLQRSRKLMDVIRGVDTPTRILQLPEIQALFNSYELPTIVSNDETLTTENADGTTTDARPMAANKSFFVPAGGIGNTLWGPTAESRALIGTPLARQAPGIIAVTYGTTEPPAEWVKAAAVAFPTMPNAHLLAQATLYP